MNAIVFIGPTIREAEARQELDAVYLPPAQVGDVYRAALEGPSAIGIIDGYFERVPSVWHKEVLWALKRGIRVFGAASMGALRAAELDVFGMEGVGDIFRAFRAGDLQDDDEVAVAHGDASTGYRAGSEAMVNIRATLKIAAQQHVISNETRTLLEGLAKKTFYPERSYAALIAQATLELGELAELQSLKTFVASHRVDAKHADAIALLRRIRESEHEPVRRYSFELSNSEPWTQLRAWARDLPRLVARSEDLDESLLAAEARCHGQRGRAVIAGAFARALAAASSRTIASGEASLNGYIVSESRDVGLYDQLARRAVDKQNTLARYGFAEPTFADTGMPASYLVTWYLSQLDTEHHAEAAVPERVLRVLGLQAGADLELEALREYLYQKLIAQTGSEL